MGDRMFEAQFGGMQCKSRSKTRIGDAWFSKRFVVNLLAAYKMASGCQMDSYLMRATGFESAFDPGKLSQRFQVPNVGDSVLSVLGIGRYSTTSIAAVSN